MIEILIKPPPPSPNLLNTKHWSYRHSLKKRILKEVWGQMVGKYVKVPITIHATRYSIQTMDSDNLIASMKDVLDAITQIIPRPDGYTRDKWKRWADAPMHLSLGEIAQERVKTRKEEKMVLKIEQGGE